MVQIGVIRTERFTSEEIALLTTKCLDTILLNSRKLSKEQILNKIANLRDEIDKYT